MKVSPPLRKPDYSCLTDEQLGRALAAFGLKPITGKDRRVKMINLLQRCYEGIRSRPGVVHNASKPQRAARPSTFLRRKETPGRFLTKTKQSRSGCQVSPATRLSDCANGSTRHKGSLRLILV